MPLFMSCLEGYRLLKNPFVSVPDPRSGARNANFGPFRTRSQVVNRPNSDFFNRLVFSETADNIG